MVRSPIGSVVQRRTMHVHLFLFFHSKRGTYDADDLVPDGVASLSQGQSVSRIRRLYFVSFLFYRRARRDTAAKKHRCIFPPGTTMNYLRFLKRFILMEQSNLLKLFSSHYQRKRNGYLNISIVSLLNEVKYK